MTTYIQIENPDPNRWYRRAISFPLVWILLFFLPLLCCILPFSLLVDLISRKTTISRALLFIGRYIINQNIGIALCFVCWIELQFRGDIEVFQERNHQLQHWWAKSLLNSLQRLFEFNIIFDGEVPSCGGKLLFVRHVSSADTLLPLLAVILPQKLKCHYVLKKELCWDPCLDIVGHRIPNAIIDRGNGQEEITRIIKLVAAIEPNSCLVFYPEGTRFSPQKRQRLIERLTKKNSDILPLAKELKSCLPPRLGGSLGLIANNPQQPIVFMGHTGFDVVENILSLINGALYQKQIHVRFWQQLPPEDSNQQEKWLYQQWQILDKWLCSLQTESESS